MKALAWHPAALHSSNVCPRLCGRSWQPRLSTHRGDGSIASCSGRPGHSGSTSVALSGQRAEGSEESCGVGRRAVLAGAALTLTCLRSTPAGAFVTPPPGLQDAVELMGYPVPGRSACVSCLCDSIFRIPCSPGQAGRLPLLCARKLAASNGGLMTACHAAMHG